MIIIPYFHDLIKIKCDILETDGIGYTFSEPTEVVYLYYLFKINIIFVFSLMDYPKAYIY